jgi:hypothetical protein
MAFIGVSGHLILHVKYLEALVTVRSVHLDSKGLKEVNNPRTESRGWKVESREQRAEVRG